MSKKTNKPNPNMTDINALMGMLGQAVDSNDLDGDKTVNVQLSRDMLEKLQHQLSRLTRYEENYAEQIKQNQERDKKFEELENKLSDLKETNQELEKNNDILKNKINLYKNLLENIKVAIQTKNFELLESTDYGPYCEEAIKDIANTLEQFVAFNKKVSATLAKVQEARLIAFGITSSSEKNTGKSKSKKQPKAPKNDESVSYDDGTSYTSQQAIDAANRKDIEQMAKDGAINNEYILDLPEYQTKYHAQLTEIKNDPSMIMLEGMLSGTQDASRDDIFSWLESFSQFISSIVVGKAMTDGNQYAQKFISIEEKAENYAENISGIRFSSSTNEKTISTYCKKCGRTHEFNIGHVVDENEVLAFNGTNVVKHLDPSYQLTSADPECQHSFVSRLSSLNVSKVMYEEFGCSAEAVEATLCNSDLSEETRLSEAIKIILNKDNSVINKNRGNFKTTNTREHTRQYRQASNTKLVYDKSGHTEQLRNALNQGKKVDNINKAARKARARQIELNADIANVAQKFNIITDENKKFDYIDPNSFNYEVYGATPFFKSSSLSCGVMAAATGLMSLYSPKNRVFQHLSSICLDCDFVSRQTLTQHVNSLGRVLHGINQQSKRDILGCSSSVSVDETVGLVRNGEGKLAQRYVMAVRTGKTEPQQECVLEAYPDRTADSIFRFLSELNPNIVKCKTIKTDGYSAYTKLIDKNKKCNIKHSSCLTHARRPFHDYLKAAKLLEIYNEDLLPKGTEFSQFCINLQNYVKDNPYAINHIDLLILIAYYIINSIFAVDGMVSAAHDDYSSDKFKSELSAARSNYSVKLFYILNKIIELLVNRFGLLELNKSGTKYFISKEIYDKDKAKGILYWMNARNNLTNCIDSPDIELSQSGVERAIRPFAIGRRVSLFMDSEDGLSAFADIHTIMNNCMYAGVPIDDYLVWAMSNVKYRALEVLKNKDVVKAIQAKVQKLSGSPYQYDVEVLKLPSRCDCYVQTTSSEMKTIKVGYYDERNTSSAWLNHISFEGLTPKDYKRYITNKKIDSYPSN